MRGWTPKDVEPLFSGYLDDCCKRPYVSILRVSEKAALLDIDNHQLWIPKTAIAAIDDTTVTLAKWWWRKYRLSI